MQQRFLLLFSFLFMASQTMSEMPPPVLVGIETNHDYTVEELVTDIFLKGECENVSNIKAIGNNLSTGYFEGGNSVFGFSDGIIISSGDIALAEGPNDNVKEGAQFGDSTPDPDIDLFASGATFDVAGIEFDFVPIGETVSFRYVFASEEYCEFVGSVFNDVFGFFVSGPGINGTFANNAINVATIPNTSSYVTINNVNHTVNSDYYISNELEQDANQCGKDYIVSHQDLIQYDGMTVSMRATINVIPCETYHIRLLVADVGDDNLDSGVFLESQSFDLGGNIEVAATVPGSSQPIAIEDCKNGQFVFTRPDGNLDEPLNVGFTIDPNSTAEMGVDFQPIPNTVTIPAGETSAVLPIELMSDGIAEGQEFLVLQLVFPCDCIAPASDTLFFDDGTAIDVESVEIGVCAGQEFTLGPNVIAGAAPFTFLWEDGSTGSTITTSVEQVTHFAVTVTDACGSDTTAVVSAVIQPIPTAVISGNTSLCENENALRVDFEGTAPWSFSYRIDGGVPQFVSNIMQSPYWITPTEPGVYVLNNFTDVFCDGTMGGEAEVRAGEVLIEFDVTNPTCFDSEDGAINMTLSGGTPPYHIEWLPPVNDDLMPTTLTAGNYSIEVTDADGCLSVETISLKPQTGKCLNYKMYVPNAFSPNGDGFNDDFRFFPAINSNIAQVKFLHIFNRWGDLVFTENNFVPSERMPLWDGTFKGKTIDAGLFVWQAELELEDGTSELAKGELLLVR